MKRFTLILFLLAFGLVASFSQTSSDSISMKKVFGGYQYYKGEQLLTLQETTNVLKSNKFAFEQMRSARIKNTMSSIFGFAGGFMVGWPLGTAIAGGDPDWALAGIGAGLIVISIPLNNRFNQQAKEAIDIYNEGLQAHSLRPVPELKFGVIGHGIGLALRF